MAALSTKEYRESVLAQLRALSDAEIESRSAQIVQLLLQSLDAGFFGGSWSGKNVALYRSLRREVQLAELEKELKLRGVKVFHPTVTDPVACRMDFGIEPGQIDVMILPGLAFGRGGERIGRGKGFYDRYLGAMASPASVSSRSLLRLALAFEFQLFPSLPQSEMDQKVQVILTEKERVRVSG